MKHTRLIFEWRDLCWMHFLNPPIRHHVGMRLYGLARVLQNNETGGLSRPRYPNRNGFRLHPRKFVTKKKDKFLLCSFCDFLISCALCMFWKWNQTFKLCWKQGPMKPTCKARCAYMNVFWHKDAPSCRIKLQKDIVSPALLTRRNLVKPRERPKTGLSLNLCWRFSNPPAFAIWYQMQIQTLDLCTNQMSWNWLPEALDWALDFFFRYDMTATIRFLL